VGAPEFQAGVRVVFAVSPRSSRRAGGRSRGSEIIGGVTEDEILHFVGGLPGVVVVTASEANAAPEVAWGDSFFFYDPDDTPADRRMPFATLVTQDYEGFDTASNLDRDGVFRLNIAVGRMRFQELIGYPPAAHPEHASGIDFAALDRLLPHPAYAAQAWVSILNPGPATATQARALLAEGHARALKHHARRAERSNE
jgi:hypothetical protein